MLSHAAAAPHIPIISEENKAISYDIRKVSPPTTASNLRQHPTASSLRSPLLFIAIHTPYFTELSVQLVR